MTTKYLRGLQYTSGTNGRDIPIFLRMCYEFWGYCVHSNPIFQISNATNATPIQITTTDPHGLTTGRLVGISGVLGNTAANGQFIVTVVNGTQFTLNSSVGNGAYTGDGKLCVPGGMPTTPNSAPAGFFEGTITGTATGQTAVTNVVLATGTDGVTSDLGINFTSLSGAFTPSLIGKHITIWSHTDPDSTDNSIYRIINVSGTTQLQIAPFSGGTKDITTLKNNLTSRSALNYRIIDYTAVTPLSVASGNYWVGTFSDGYTINTGQANSQFQFLLRGSSTPFGNFGIVGSPAGTWNGSSFPGSSMTEQATANTSFTGTTVGALGYVTLIASKNFFIGHVKSPNANTQGIYFYITVPQRIYTQAQDLNPFTIMVGGNQLLSTNVTDSHSTKFSMLNFNSSTTIACQLITKNFISDGTIGSSWTVGPSLTGNLTHYTKIGRVLFSEALISSTVSGQFSLARAKLRPIAFTGPTMPNFHLIGDNGEYMHITGGVLWPWDGSILPYNLLPLGA